MKARIGICCLLVLCLGISAQAAEIPGGIVFLSKGRVLYYNLETGQETDLLPEYKGSTLKGPVAISQDGVMLVLSHKNGVWTTLLPAGKPQPVTFPKLVVTKKGKIINGRPVKIIPQGRNVRNLRISPQGDHIAYESTREDKALIEVSGNSNAHQKRVSFRYPPYFRDKRKRKNYLAYVQELDSYDGFTAICMKSHYGNIFHFGNVAFYPGKFPYLDVKSNGHEVLRKYRSTGQCDEYAGGREQDLSVIEAQRRFGIKRNARFLVWQRNTQMLAVIYQTANGWGPIEIRNMAPANASPRSFPTSQKVAQAYGWKPVRWEIPVSIDNCESLAWKPDGSLTYLMNENLFSLDGDLIKRGIKNSSLKVIRQGRRQAHPSIKVVAVRNVFQIKPTLIAQEINGTNLHWVSNDTFIFRGQDGALYLRREGRLKKLFPFIPEDFSYCSDSPFAIRAGTDRVREMGIGGKSFHIGTIKTGWVNNDKSVIIYIGKLEYDYPNETDIEDIRDPSQYDYKPLNIKQPRDPNIGIFPGVEVSFNQILLLKSGKKYAAIKPIKIEGRKWLTFEWKYWPVSPKE